MFGLDYPAPAPRIMSPRVTRAAPAATRKNGERTPSPLTREHEPWERSTLNRDDSNVIPFPDQHGARLEAAFDAIVGTLRDERVRPTDASSVLLYVWHAIMVEIAPDQLVTALGAMKEFHAAWGVVEDRVHM
jgi:hypothetical protein